MEGVAQDPAGTWRVWVLVALLCLAHGLAFADRFLLAATAPLVARDLALGDNMLGVLLGPAFAMTYGLTALALAALPVEAGRAGLQIAGFIVWTLGSAATGLAGSFATLALARSAVGLGQAMALPLVLTSLIGVAPDLARGRALSWFTSGAVLGRAAAFLGGGALLALLSGGIFMLAPWRMLYLLTALPNLLVLGALALRLLRTRADGALIEREPHLVERLRGETRPIAAACLAAIASVAAAQAVAAWLPTLIVRQYGVSTAAAASLAGVVTLVASPAGQLLGGLCLDRVARFRAAPLALLVAALAVAVPGLGCAIAAGSIAIACSAIAFVVFALGVATVAGLFAVQAVIPAAQRRRSMTIFMALSTMVGAGLGPALAGAGAAFAMRGLGGALVATVAACALVAFGASRLARPQRKPARSPVP